MVACVTGVVSWSLLDARQGAFDRAVQNSQNLTAALAHDVERNLESYDLSLLGVIEGLKFDEVRTVSPELRDQILFDRAASAQFLGSVLVLGENGETLIDSRSITPRSTTYADRDYFQAQRDRNDVGLYISAPFKSRQSDEWEIALSRRLNHPDGSFAGAVIGSLKLAFFQNLFDSVDSGPHGATALFSPNQTLIIRKPYVESEWGRSMAGSNLFTEFQLKKSGWVQYRALTDGVERVATYQQVGDFPLILTVAVARDSIFSEWRQKAEIVGAALLFTILLTGFLAMFASLELRRRGRAEQAALESETRYRLLADNSSDLIVLVDLDGIRRFVSPASRALYGYEPEEMLRSDMFGAAHPDDQPRLAAAVEQLKAGTERVVVELRARCKSGDYIWVESHMRLVLDPMNGEARILGLVRDISHRHAIEQAIRESETQFRTLADTVSDLIIRTLPGGERTYVSPSCRTVLGYEPDELISAPSGSFTHPLDLDLVRERMRAIMAGDEDTLVLSRAIRRDGTVIWLEGRISLVWDIHAGRIVEIVSVMRDVSQHKAMEERMERARLHAEQASQLKSEFLANMSHEIRTPMNGIIGMTSLLLGTPLSTDQRRYADAVRISADALLSVINDILDLSKLEAGKLNLEIVPFSFATIVSDCVELLAAKAADKGIRLTSDVDARAQLTHLGDPTRLRQIILNLLANAVKFTDRGFVALHIAGETHGTASRLSIRIQDSGIGMDDAAKAKLFRKFEQADGSVARRFGGTGLGLAISKQLIDRMEGTIGVVSELGEGSIFTVELTLPTTSAAPSELAPLADAQAANATAPREDRPRKILVAEDNHINQLLVVTLLEEAGYLVDVAEDGLEALAAIRRENYDLVLMDAQMPNMDGLQATRAIRDLGDGRGRIPIIALTANAMAGDREHYLAAGMDDYLSKPLDAASMLSMVQAWIAGTPYRTVAGQTGLNEANLSQIP